MDQDDINIEEEDKEEELAPVVIRTEQERREYADKMASDKATKNLKESKDFALNSLTSISLTELQRLKEDE